MGSSMESQGAGSTSGAACSEERKALNSDAAVCDGKEVEHQPKAVSVSLAPTASRPGDSGKTMAATESKHAHSHTLPAQTKPGKNSAILARAAFWDQRIIQGESEDKNVMEAFPDLPGDMFKR